jgi:hypothetical protein
MRPAAEKQRILIAGASLRRAARRGATRDQAARHPGVELTLVDRNDHQTLTELPQVGAGAHAADAVRVPLQRVMRERVGFRRDRRHRLRPGRSGAADQGRPGRLIRLVLALGTRPNDFAIPGLGADRDPAYLVDGPGRTVARRSSRPPRPIGSGSRMGRRRCSKTIEVRTSATSGRPVSRSMTKA